MHSVVSQTEIKMININETNKNIVADVQHVSLCAIKSAYQCRQTMRDLNIRLSIKLNVLTVAFVKRFVLYSIKHIMYFQIPHILFVIKF